MLRPTSGHPDHRIARRLLHHLGRRIVHHIVRHLLHRFLEFFNFGSTMVNHGADYLMKHITYFVFFVSLFTAINPFWTNHIRLLDSSKKIFLLRTSGLNFDFPVWQSIFFVSFVGLLLGLGSSLYTELPRSRVISIGIGLAWTAFVVNLLILRCCIPHKKFHSSLKKLLNILAASWVIVGIAISGLIIATRGGLLFLTLTTPLIIYYALICGKSLYIAIPNLSVGRAVVGELTALIAVATTICGLAHLLDVDISSFITSRQ